MKEKRCHAFQSGWNLISPARQPWNSYMMKVKGTNKMQQLWWIVMSKSNLAIGRWEWQLAARVLIIRSKLTSLFYILQYSTYYINLQDVGFVVETYVFGHVFELGPQQVSAETPSKSGVFSASQRQGWAVNLRPLGRVACLVFLVHKKMMKFHGYSGPFHLLRQSTWLATCINFGSLKNEALLGVPNFWDPQ